VGTAVAENSLAEASFFSLPPLRTSAKHGAQKKVGHHVGAGRKEDDRGVGEFFHLHDERPDKNNEGPLRISGVHGGPFRRRSMLAASIGNDRRRPEVGARC